MALATDSLLDAHTILEALECSEGRCTCHRSARLGKGKTHCPAHEDRTPAFSVNDKNGQVVWHCFAGCDQATTTKAMVERGILGRPSGDRPTVARPVTPPRVLVAPVDQVVPALEAALLEAALAEYRKLMPHSPGERYLRQRGLPTADAGFAPGGPYLRDRLMVGGRKATPEELVAAGLVYPLDGAGRPSRGGHDILSHRVVLPYTWGGRVSCLYGRAVHPKASLKHRYTSSEGRWPKGAYGESALQQPRFAVVEGALDAIAISDLSGVPAVAVGGLGGSALEARFSALAHKPHILLAFDADPALDRDHAPDELPPGDTARKAWLALAPKGAKVWDAIPPLSSKDWAGVCQDRATARRRGEPIPPFKLAEYTHRARPANHGEIVAGLSFPIGYHRGMPNSTPSEAIWTVHLPDAVGTPVEGPLSAEAKAQFMERPSGPATPVTPYRKRSEVPPPSTPSR
ncbi:MAG: hypothetical protein ACYCTZ_04880 [Candidatus Dormibacteria bacterium]